MWSCANKMPLTIWWRKPQMRCFWFNVEMLQWCVGKHKSSWAHASIVHKGYILLGLEKCQRKKRAKNDTAWSSYLSCVPISRSNNLVYTDTHTHICMKARTHAHTHTPQCLIMSEWNCLRFHTHPALASCSTTTSCALYLAVKILIFSPFFVVCLTCCGDSQGLEPRRKQHWLPPHAQGVSQH